MNKSLKDFLSGLFLFVTNLVMCIPFHYVRLRYLRCFMHIGKKSSVMSFVEVRKPCNVFIGNQSVVNKKVLLDGRGGKLIIKDNVDIAQETNIWTLEHDVNDDFHCSVGADVVIEDYVWIASRVTILPGVHIGRGAVVACCSVVTKDVPQMAIVAGIPAKVVGKRRNNLKYKHNYFPWFG